MKHHPYLLTFFMSLLAATSVFSQHDSSTIIKSPKYKIYVYLISEMKMIKGYPVAITDSGIWITKGFRPRKRDGSRNLYPLMFIKADNMDEVAFRRKNRIGRGILIGGGGGAVVGSVLVAAISNSKNPNSKRAAWLSGAGIGFQMGGLIGGFTGGRPNKKFRIRGDATILKNARETLCNLSGKP